MVTTRPQARQAFTHIFDQVLGKDDNSPLKRAVIAQGINDVFQLVNIDENTIEDLVYDQSDTDTDVPVQRGDKGHIRAFVFYVQYLQNTNDPLANDWLHFTPEHFDDFRVNSYHPLVSTSVTTSPATTTTGPASKYTPAEMFKRGI
jgi:hypothetical protein